ncbi:MAG: hypothetical protein HAW59_06515 [Betaproteobacteria bacterium]|nr:hypothetical protein [Betaproteobacteria bacterium]
MTFLSIFVAVGDTEAAARNNWETQCNAVQDSANCSPAKTNAQCGQSRTSCPPGSGSTVGPEMCECPSGMRFNGRGSLCVKETCGANEFRSVDESCTACRTNERVNTAGNLCVLITCNLQNQVRSSDESCRTVMEEDCPMDGEYPTPQNEMVVCTACADTEEEQNGGLGCRPRVESDCEATESFAAGLCTPRVAANCTGNTPVFVMATSGPGGICRAAAEDDCSTAGQTPMPQNGLPNCTTCSGTTIEDADGLRCRAVMESDCPAAGVAPMPQDGLPNCTACTNTEVEETNGLNCRARVAADCGAMVFQNGVCRAEIASDCATNGENVDGEYPNPQNGLPNCTACGNTETEDSNGLNCRARVAADCAQWFSKTAFAGRK